MSIDLKSVDINDILLVTNEPGTLFEVMIVSNGKQYGGIFDSHSAAALEVEVFEASCENVEAYYRGLNPLNGSTKATNTIARIDKRPKNSDVARLVWFMVDIDVKSKGKHCATDAELKLAMKAANVVLQYLAPDFVDPLVAHSGNGIRLLYRIDLPNDQESVALTSRLLYGLDSMLHEVSDEYDDIAVDTGCFNPNRLDRMFGTINRKGLSETPERPFRQTGVIRFPGKGTTSDEALRDVAERFPVPVAKTKTKTKISPVGSEALEFLKDNGFEIRKDKPLNNGGQLYEIIPCPFNSDHSKGEASIELYADGGIHFNCKHESCNHTWEDVCELLVSRPEPLVPFQDWPVDPFPVDAVNGVFREYTQSLADAYQVPFDFAFWPMVGAFSAGLAGRVRVAVNADWSEPANLWIAVLANPSERKSPVVRKWTKAIGEYVAEERKRLGPEHRERTKEKEVLLNRAEKMRADASKTDDDDDMKDLLQKAEHLEQLAADIKIPYLPRFLCDDCTQEKLFSLLSENKERMAIITDEGGLFKLMTGKYAGSVDVDIYTHGYDGNAMTYDRVSRPSIHLENPTITQCLFIQPQVISGLRETVRNELRSLGLLSRYLYSQPQSNVGSRLLEPPLVDRKLEAIVFGALRTVLALDPTSEAVAVPLSSAARKALLGLQASLEPRLGPDGDLRGIGDWAGKLAGNCLRLALVMHCMNEAKRPVATFDLSKLPPISGEAMESAVTIANYSISHALRIFGEHYEDPSAVKAKKLLPWLEERKGQTFTAREFMRKNRSFATMDEVNAVLKLYVAHGYIQRVDLSGLRRNSAVYQIRDDWD